MILHPANDLINGASVIVSSPLAPGDATALYNAFSTARRVLSLKRWDLTAARGLDAVVGDGGTTAFCVKKTRTPTSFAKGRLEGLSAAPQDYRNGADLDLWMRSRSS